jgi:hypothetical protein
VFWKDDFFGFVLGGPGHIIIVGLKKLWTNEKKIHPDNSLNNKQRLLLIQDVY